jgi:hypothetical protein
LAIFEKQEQANETTPKPIYHINFTFWEFDISLILSVFRSGQKPSANPRQNQSFQPSFSAGADLPTP